MQIAIIIDWQNLFMLCNGEGIETIIGAIISMAQNKGEIQELRLFVPAYQSPGPWKSLNFLQLKFGVDVSVCPILREDATGVIKDTVDFQVLRWVMTHIYQGVGPELLVFVTSDGDFIVPANEARKRGKQVEFWNLGKNVSRAIEEQEQMRVIKFAPPPISSDNPFLAAATKLNTGEPLTDDDKSKLLAIGRTNGASACFGIWPATEELFSKLGEGWNVTPEEARQIVEALMVLDIARIFPAMSTTLCVDRSSPLFPWISNSVGDETAR